MNKITSGLFCILILASSAFANEPLSAGINFLLGFWNMGNQSNFFSYTRQNGREHVETGGLGGWVSFVSRTSDFWTFELSFGGFGQAEGYSNDDFNTFWDDDDDDIDATAVVPILFGVQRDLLTITNSSTLRPYVSFGGGPYWITDVRDHSFNGEEVTSKIEPGAYFGGGLNFLLGKKFAINFDGRYHVVNFDPDNDISGLEVGVGFTVLWGSYKSNK